MPDPGPQAPERLVTAVRDRLCSNGLESVAVVTTASVATALAQEGMVLGGAALAQMVQRVRAELTGAGPLQSLLDGDGVSDVLVNGPGAVWIDRGAGVVDSGVRLDSEPAIRALAVRLAAQAGRRLDDASPAVDARLPDGVRLHAVIPPIASGGTHLSLRVPQRRAFTLQQLTAVGTIPVSWQPLLSNVVARRRSFLVSGGTGVGKTTVLATLLGLCDPTDRVVMVEDAGELLPNHPHLVRLQARSPNAEGRGGVDLVDLVRQALRMRPDRVVVGECRGAEVRDLLTALNTGHDGGCGTVHANAAVDVVPRLEALAALAGMDRAAVHSQMFAALDLVLHLRRRGGVRQLAEIAVLERAASGEVTAVPALRIPSEGHVDDSPPDGVPVGERGPGWHALMELVGPP